VPKAGAIVCCALLLCACRKAPEPPVTDPPDQVEIITGAERLGWEQPARDVVELAGIGYAIYVDGAREELQAAACGAEAAAGGFSCSAPLPALTPGSHTLELASFIDDGGLLESARSAALRVIVTAPATGGGSSDPIARGSLARSVRAGVRLELLVADLDDVTDLAFTPDGRLLVAERRGRIRVMRQNQLLNQPALSMADELGATGRLLALAVDPQFERTGHVFAIYSAPAPAGGDAFALARFREVSDTLGDRAVLLDGVPASADPRAAMRFGPDGKLYVAFDDGGDPERARDGASLNGKLLRLNPDGTTPRDQEGATPVYLGGLRSPRGFDWHPQSGGIWSADGGAGRSGLLRSAMRQSVRGDYALPPPTHPSSMAFYNGKAFPFANDLLVASESAGHLLRLRIDPASEPVALDYLLEGVAGGVRSVAIGPLGVIYVSTRTAVARLVPDRG
jgi:quinoprotein glucose dehydrogenase